VSSLHSRTQGEKDEVRPFSQEGYICWVRESSKAYRIYIPGQRQIEVSRDVSFEEEVAFKRSRGSHMQLMGASRSTKRDLWPEDSLRWRE
jgi:hypothetical protein